MSEKLLRKFTDEQRLAIVKEAQELGTTVTLRKYKVTSSLLHSWRKKYNVPPRASQASPGARGGQGVQGGQRNPSSKTQLYSYDGRG